MRSVVLIKANQVEKGDLILCYEGDAEMLISSISPLGRGLLSLVDKVSHRVRTLSENASVRLIKCHREGEHTHQLLDANERPLRKQHEKRNPRSYWSLAGFADEGEKYFEGPMINLQNQEQAYAALMEWILDHDLDEDYVVGVESAWNADDDDENLVLWAICVFTRGCALVAYRHRAGFE